MHAQAMINTHPAGRTRDLDALVSVMNIAGSAPRHARTVIMPVCTQYNLQAFTSRKGALALAVGRDSQRVLSVIESHRAGSRDAAWMSS